jgi:myo-inositol-1(or 4)-monophosphatase
MFRPSLSKLGNFNGIAMHPMLNTAVKAARRAATIINRASFDVDQIKVTQKHHNDFVTEVDQAAERAIIDVLKQAYPDHAILAEESGASSNLHDENEHVWIIDPIDGTTNFIHGFPQYAVSIGLQYRGQITQAVVFDPTRNELFTASKGAGAYLNDKRAASLDLAYVAAGRLDGFFEKKLKPWDMAAGSLLITEAGGIVGNFSGDADYLYHGDVIAASPKIFSQMINVLSPFAR